MSCQNNPFTLLYAGWHKSRLRKVASPCWVDDWDSESTKVSKSFNIQLAGNSVKVKRSHLRMFLPVSCYNAGCHCNLWLLWQYSVLITEFSKVVVVWSGFNVAFNNFSVISRWCLVATGRSMHTFIGLPHWSIMPQTLNMIPHPVILSCQWIDQS